MKKTYTSDEVIDLFNQYQNECGCEEYEGWSYNKSFEQWLKDKEQLSLESEMFANFSRKNISEKLTLPIKGQEIWVTNNDDDIWYKGEFIKFVSGENGDVYASIQESPNIFWQMYSLADPNQ